MTAISASDVKALRDRTGAGVLACREALAGADGDVERAVEILRTRGEVPAAKRAGADRRTGGGQRQDHGGRLARFAVGGLGRGATTTRRCARAAEALGRGADGRARVWH